MKKIVFYVLEALGAVFAYLGSKRAKSGSGAIKSKSEPAQPGTGSGESKSKCSEDAED